MVKHEKEFKIQNISLKKVHFLVFAVLQGQAVLQLANLVEGVKIFGTASAHKHEAIKDKVSHLFDHGSDYIQEIRK